MALAPIQRSQTPIESARRNFCKTVYSLSEMRNHITACAVKQQACVIELGADIVLDDHGIVMPTSIPFFLLDGNNKNVVLTQNVTSFIDIRAGTAASFRPCHILNLRYNIAATYTSTYFAYDGSAAAHTNVSMQGVYAAGCTNIFGLFRLNYGAICNNIFTGVSAATAELFGTTNVRDSYIAGNVGNFTISLSTADSVGNVFVGNVVDTINNSYSVTSFKRNTWCGTVSQNLTWTVYDIVVGGAYNAPAAETVKPTTVSLTADNQSVSTSATSLIYLSSDNAVAANRTFTLTAGQNGQRLVLLCVANACELLDSGTANLSATWTAGVADTLSLIYSTTTASWCELSRSNN